MINMMIIEIIIIKVFNFSLSTELFRYVVGGGGFGICMIITGATCFCLSQRKNNRRLITNSESVPGTNIALPHVYDEVGDDEFLHVELNDNIGHQEHLSVTSSNSITSVKDQIIGNRSYTSLVEVLKSDKHDYDNPDGII